jgi:hypothetical protein
MKIAHIINPVKVSDKSDLFIAQPITFETMKNAKEFAKKNNVEVELFYTCYEEDLEIAPKGFKKTKLLEKSILDYGNFKTKRKLPLIKDILDRLYESSNADYFIYTNVDIALMPHFYNFIANVIKRGYDGFVINRRTISKNYSSIDEIPQMYSEIGEKHPGYDCFVFKRDVYPKYQLGTACIGANWIGRVIISNVIAHSNKFKVFENEHLTFHIGDDRSWKIDKFSDYDTHNENILISILEKIFENSKAHTKSLLQLFYKQHTKKDLKKINIIKKHIFKHKLNISFEEIYGTSYKPSKNWDNPVFLRQDPVFIVGYPRSGTTLLQSLLATQENIVSLPETHFFNWVRSKIIVKNDRVISSQVNTIINAIRERISFSIDAEQYIQNLAIKNLLSPKMLFEILVVDNLIKQGYDINYLKQKKWVEKTPDHVLHLDTINRFYPKSKIIYMLRNPEQAIISRRENFLHETNWNIKRHINCWLQSIEAIEKFQDKYPERVRIIKLEDLVENKEDVIKNICDFLEIDFNIKNLNNYKIVANQFILPWENWKNDVKNSEISSKIAIKNKKLKDQEYRVLVNSLKEKLIKYNYWDSRFKITNLNENAFTFEKNRYQQKLMNAFEELCSYSVFKEPIKKIKAYKNLLKVYHETK